MEGALVANAILWAPPTQYTRQGLPISRTLSPVPWIS